MTLSQVVVFPGYSDFFQSFFEYAIFARKCETVSRKCEIFQEKVKHFKKM